MIENPLEWKILKLFSQTPTQNYFVKEIARNLKISPGSSSKTCKTLAQAGILTKKKRGNLLLYKLCNETFFVKEIKRLIFLSELYKYKQHFENAEFQWVILYGSYANGEYIERSDVDILVITNISERKAREDLDVLGKLGKEISITVFPLSHWLELKNKGDPFYKEVVANHIVLFGEKLVV